MDMLIAARTPTGEEMVAALGRLLAAARGGRGCGAGTADEGGAEAENGRGNDAGLSAGIEGMEDEDLLVFLRDAETVGRLADAARILGAGEIEQRSRASLGADRMSYRHGCRTASELVERVTMVSGATARQRMRTARPLRGTVSLTGERLPGAFPRVREAVEAGVLGVDAAQAITSPLGEALAHGAAPGEVWQAEGQLVATAVTGSGEGTSVEERGNTVGMPADEVAVMSRVWALHLDPDGLRPTEEEGMRRRGVTLGRMRGGTIPRVGNSCPKSLPSSSASSTPTSPPATTRAVPGATETPPVGRRARPVPLTRPTCVRHMASWMRTCAPMPNVAMTPSPGSS